MSEVVIIQALSYQYRIPFYRQLRSILDQHDVHFTVIYSDPPSRFALREDKVDLPKEIGCKVPASWIFGDRLLYHFASKRILQSDLVICQQEAKYIWLYLLALLSRMGLKKFALWGHGTYKGSNQARIGKWLKDRLIASPDWWFAYTSGCAPHISEGGMPAERITVVDNAIDTRALSAEVSAISEQEKLAYRRRIGIADGASVALYIGAIEPGKKLRFLVRSAEKVRERYPNFHLVIAGSGSDRSWAEALSNDCDWIHYVGPIFGHEKALCTCVAELFLIPAQVGLAVLDAFAAGLPVISTNTTDHGPEFEYLSPGVNGIVTDFSEEDYANAVCSLLANKDEVERMRNEARNAAAKFTVERMANNFATGILTALKA